MFGHQRNQQGHEGEGHRQSVPDQRRIARRPVIVGRANADQAVATNTSPSSRDGAGVARTQSDAQGADDHEGDIRRDIEQVGHAENWR